MDTRIAAAAVNEVETEIDTNRLALIRARENWKDWNRTLVILGTVSGVSCCTTLALSRERNGAIPMKLLPFSSKKKIVSDQILRLSELEAVGDISSAELEKAENVS